jgi:hypothetical protein
MFWGIIKLVEKVKPIIKAAIAAAQDNQDRSQRIPLPHF